MEPSHAPHEPPSPAVLRRASSAPEMERKLRTALAIEHQRRVVAEGRAEQIASLSPIEQAMLAAWARTARVLHAPKPRCLCCGGPLFWMCIVPWLLCVLFTGGSPLVLIAPPPPAEAPPVSERAFYPSRAPRSGPLGTFNKFPPYIEDPLSEKMKLAKAAAAAARLEGVAPFKPTGRGYSTPTPSIVFKHL